MCTCAEVRNPEVSICDGMRPISLRYGVFLERLRARFLHEQSVEALRSVHVLHLARAIPRAATWFADQSGELQSSGSI